MELLLGRISENGRIDMQHVDPIQKEYIEQLKADGFIEVTIVSPPTCGEGFIAQDTFTVEDGKMVQSWCITKDYRAMQLQVKTLKAQLAETDYQVTKCYECSLVGEELPYDIHQLHIDRQALRDQINSLEAEIINANQAI